MLELWFGSNILLANAAKELCIFMLFLFLNVSYMEQPLS